MGKNMKNLDVYLKNSIYWYCCQLDKLFYFCKEKNVVQSFWWQTTNLVFQDKDELNFKMKHHNFDML